MNPQVSKRLRLLVSVLSVLLLLIALFGAWFYFRLRASLPLLDGEARVGGLSKSVTIERDALGVPTIHGASRLDVAHALGFLHAQDRFFQMDLSRRRAAGELSALFGKAAFEADKRVRVHDFRRLAETVLTRLPADQRALLEAYSAGVNEGLNGLRVKPFEYIVLRSSPEAWTPTDSVLLIYAMTLDLQNDRGGYEQSLAALRDVLGNAALAYFAPLIGPDDAAIDGTTAPLSRMPNEHEIDLRRRAPPASASAWLRTHVHDDSVLYGSNGFVLAGKRTASGAAMVANDMHLGLRIPNTWYRASLVFTSAVSNEELHVTGVTLPGTPLVVAGSNGHIAWGFTNANADMSDLVVINQSSIDPTLYNRGKDILQIEKRKSTIALHNGDTVETETDWTVFGPIVGKNAERRPLALKWTMDDPDSANFALVGLETATTVEEGFAVAHRSGIPNQNIVIADMAGNIGWTLCGRLPKRIGFDGRLPTSWAFGDRRWDGYVAENDLPSVLNPESGQIWTANQRVVDRDALLVLGDGGYERPQRAARIRDLLTPLQHAEPKDLLAIQLDDSAPYLNRWHDLLVQILDDKAIAENKDRGRLKAVLTPWDGRAEVASVSYRMVRRFRAHVADRVLTPIFAPCAEAYPDFTYRRFHVEAALWDLITKKPAHLLDPAFASWDEVLLTAADDVLAEIGKEHVPLERATWGEQNVAQIKHPFAKIAALAGWWLSLPHDSLPGDYDTPRVQAPDDGASERFVVSPGHEDQGIFEMPGGQSAHPLSPFFKAGHSAWVKGEASPFLPGKTEHTLTLTPK